MSGKIARRRLLSIIGASSAGAALAACGATPTPQVIREVVTQVVEKEVTKIVEGTPVVEVVKETVVVEQVVEQTVIVEKAAEGLPMLRFAMYNFDPWLQALPKIFGDFEAEVGTAQVKLEAAPWELFWTRFESQAAAGIAPDLQIGDPGVTSRYIDKGIYLNIDPYIDRDKVDLALWLPATVGASEYDTSTGLMGSGKGSIWGMPATFVGTVLYFNKDLFDAAGVAYPDDTWTRAELEAAALALTKDKSGNTADSGGMDPENVDIYGASVSGSGYNHATFLWNEGAAIVSDDQKSCLLTEPAAVATTQWMADLILVQHVNPSPAWFAGQPDVFLTQKIAFKYDGSWNVDYYVDKVTYNWDLAPVALGTSGLPRMTYAGTNTLHIYSGTKFKDQSWDLLLYMASEGGQKYFLKTGTPCLISTANSPDYLTGKPEHRQIAVDIGNYAHNYYPHRNSDKWKEVYGPEMDAIWLGERTAEEAAASFCEKVTPILQA